MLNSLAFFGAPDQMLIVLLVVLVLFGGKKIPELMRGVGRGVGELQKGLDEGKQHFKDAMNSEAHADDAAKAQTPVVEPEKATVVSTTSTEKEK